jgi:putative endonuclease
MTNKYNKVLYTGVTNNLAKRIDAHKNKTFKGFTQKYNVDKLVYAEACDNIGSAIAREKQIKGGSRKKKIDLIKSVNPDFEELFC